MGACCSQTLFEPVPSTIVSDPPIEVVITSLPQVLTLVTSPIQISDHTEPVVNEKTYLQVAPEREDCQPNQYEINQLDCYEADCENSMIIDVKVKSNLVRKERVVTQTLQTTNRSYRQSGLQRKFLEYQPNSLDDTFSNQECYSRSALELKYMADLFISVKRFRASQTYKHQKCKSR